MQPKILITSENFSQGGLETQIYTTYQTLKDRAEFTFAFGHLEGDWDFGNSAVEVGLNFSKTPSVKNLISDTKHLVALIRQHNITAIHAHPFYSLLPAIFASQLTNTPLFYTYHGFGSLNFASQYNDSVFLDFALDELFACVFFVYQDIANTITKQYRTLKANYLPNAIDFDNYPQLTTKNNHEWAFATRLSSEKLDGIFLVLSHLREFNIKKLHFYGNGDCANAVLMHARSLGVEDLVVFHEYCDLRHGLDGKYNGLFAMGRSALEGIAFQLPVVVVGYGKFFGLVNASNIANIATDNFAPIFCPAVDADTVAAQISSIHTGKSFPSPYQFAREKFDYRTVGSTYLDLISNLRSPSRDIVKALYRDLATLEDQNANFASSPEVTALLIKHLFPQSLDKTLRTYANIQPQLAHLQSSIIQLQQSITNLQEENAALSKALTEAITEIDAKITAQAEIMQGVGLRTVTKNTFRHLKSKR